jgi:hypothetical protein
VQAAAQRYLSSQRRTVGVLRTAQGAVPGHS